MPELSHTQILAALEEVRAGKDDTARVSELEEYLVGLLLDGGTAAVGAILLNLDGMKFTLVDAPEAAPNVVFRSDHEGNALVVEAYAVEDLAVISITQEEGDVPQLPAGHQWFYRAWERLIDDDVEDPGSLAEPDRTIYLIASFEADVMNGGVGQYLSNTDGGFVKETISALQMVNANQTASCLEDAAALKFADESWDDLWVRSARQLDAITQRLMAADEYLALLTATCFGQAGGS